MSYYASGEGTVILKNGANANEVLDLIGDSFEGSIFDNKITLWQSGNWYEEETEECLNTIAPFITDGTITYDGEENCHWRYIFNDGKWEEQNGMVYFSYEDMIKDLEKEGYTIKKVN